MATSNNDETDPKKDAPAGLFDSALAASVKASAQQIWLAGLGAFAKAQEEGGKVFEALVREGSALQRKSQTAEERLGDVSSRVSSVASDMGARAGQQWDKLETLFEERTTRALGKLGVPSAKDVAALAQRVDELSAEVARLTRMTRARKVRSASAPSGGAVQPAAKRVRKKG